MDDCGRKRKSDFILTKTFSDASSEIEIFFKNQNYLNQIRGLSGNSRVDRTNHFPADIPMNRPFVSRREFSTAGRMPRRGRPNLGFTLVELLVSISIIGLLSGMLLPAVQMIRESARLSSCANNLKNLGLGLLSYESAHRSFPHGSNFGTEFSWGAKILPWLEQKTLHDQIDWSQSWDAVGINQAISRQKLPVFRCPTSLKSFDGCTDYCGISGSWRTSFPMNSADLNGMLYPAAFATSRPIEIGTVYDGTSQTIIVSEGVTVLEINHGFWACGLNCFTHDEAGVNGTDRPEDEIVSDHAAGANAVFCDGSVHFINQTLLPEIVAALCTRNGYELDVAF